jgi:Protein of unknown function (DUF3617)
MLGQKWIVTCGIGLFGATMLVAHAAQETAHLNVKLGLWEMAMDPKISGDAPSIPQDQLANMTPEQRARIQAAMQEMMASLRQPKMMKECMTPEKLAKGFNTGSQDSSNCKTSIVKNTGSEFESTQQCSDREGNRTSKIHVSALSSDHILGTVHSDMAQSGMGQGSGKGMTFDATIEGKWVGADCGTVKDVEIEKIPK